MRLRRRASRDRRFTLWRRGTIAGLAVAGVVWAAQPAGAQSDPRPMLAPIVRTERLATGTIRVVYDLNAPADEVFVVTLEASNDDGRTFAIHPQATKGDVGPGVTPGAGKVIEWNSSKDTEELQVERFVFRVLASPAAPALKIVILEGEHAVNHIHEKSIVAPVVEVRDGNDLPVFGATVTFSITGARTAAFANGASTLTVTTNATGRAVAAGATPVDSGSVQINVRAAFQRQIAVVTIEQTNVAQAAAGPGGGATTGGGMSRGVLAGIASAAAAGAGVVVTKGKGGSPTSATYLASISGPLVTVFPPSGSGRGCERTEVLTGTLTLTLLTAGDGTVSGTGTGAFSSLTTADSCSTALAAPRAGTALRRIRCAGRPAA